MGTMISVRSAIVAFSLGWASLASAADLDIQVRGADGRPVRDAVVTVRLAAGATPAPKTTDSFAIDQQQVQFHRS